MKTPKTGPASSDLEVVVSSGAGRLLFALMLSDDPEIYKVANIARKALPQYIAEILAQPLGPDKQDPDMSHSIPQLPKESLDIDPEEKVERACQAADQLGDTRAQAVAVVDAWRLFFPKLAYAEEVVKRQDLQTRKAKEWVNLAGSATTLFGWLGGVDEGKLLSMQFPLAWVNKMIVNKAKEVKEHEKSEGLGEEEVMDNWREYAQEMLEKGVNKHVGEKLEGTLYRLSRPV